MAFAKRVNQGMNLSSKAPNSPSNPLPSSLALRLPTREATQYLDGFIYIDLENTQDNLPPIIITSHMPKTHTVQTVILVSSDELIDVQNFLMNLLAQENQQALKLTELSLLAVKSASLQQIINATYELLNDPIIVVDNAYKVISSSTNYAVSDPLWKKIIIDSYAPYSLLIEMNRIVTNSNPDDRLAPFYVKCGLSPVHKLAIKLIFDNHDIGYIVMFNKPTEIGPQHWSMLPKIANILSEVISKTPKFREMAACVTEFLKA